MSDTAKKNLTAADIGRMGGLVKSKRKSAAARKTLAIARKSRWLRRSKRTA